MKIIKQLQYYWHISSFIAADTVECVATWSEGLTQYLMTRLVQGAGGTEDQYRCFTYQEEESGQYRMSQTGSEVCGPLGRNFDKTYKVFDETKGIKWCLNIIIC